MWIVSALIGFFLLILGRQFYAVFVGGVIVLLAARLGQEIPYLAEPSNLMVFSLAAGVLAGTATLWLRRGAAAVAGFVAGGGALLLLPQVFGWSTGWFSWLIFILAGLISALLVLAAFDYYVILLTAVVGAALLAVNIHISGISAASIFLVSLLIGLLTQVILMQYGRGFPD